MVAILGLMTVPASVMLGFRHDPNAPAANFLFNIGLFVAYMTVHIVMLLPAFKKAVYGQPRSTQRERRVFILVSVITWVILYAVHKPVPGFAFAAPLWVQYVGACGVFLGFLMFYEGVTFGFIDAFIGMPGTELSHSADTSTPLMTEGSYARVRHPMYRGAVTYLLFSLLIHPHAGQLLFVVIIALGFVLFIPFEERGLLKARGDEYTVYMQTVRYRVFPGIW
jgi:protein-S-isoprenylcysteine O-methyltransferase Ste14